MGTLVGHLAPGTVLLLGGLWQLFGHIRLFLLRPSSYVAPVWFPARGVRHLELIWLAISALIDILAELFIIPEKHRPFDADGTIPSANLHHFEHTTISLAALVFRRRHHRHGQGQGHQAAAHARRGVAAGGRVVIIVAVTLATTLLLIAYPRSVMASLVRSASLVFQGIWFIATGVMLWTPAFIPKGCFLNSEEGRQVVQCRTGEALHRAKSLVNLQFSWYLTGILLFVVVLYLQMAKLYPEQRYVPVVKEGDCSGVRFSIADDHDMEIV
ncbi:hypothetical protein BS78_02G198600 [Paspalum vaginatum]|nr:hypothetical protein BS78_02G198600 [Paspalum vaginatum]